MSVSTGWQEVTRGPQHLESAAAVRRSAGIGNGAMWIWLLLVASGCTGGAAYRASNLPPQFQAAPPRSLHNVELSRLSHAQGSTNLIRPGDTVEVAIATGLEEVDPIPREVRVDGVGKAVLPLIGPVQLAGLELPAAESAIHHESVRRGVYRNPQVSVFIKQKLQYSIAVMGAVKEPGVKKLPADSCGLLEALLAAGLASNADTRVELRFPPVNGEAQGRVSVVDLESLTRQGGDYRLPDGAVVNVRERPKQTVSVIGLVSKPGQVEIPSDRPLLLLEAIAIAGGRTLEIADRVKIIRRVPGQPEPVVIGASIKKAKQENGGIENLALLDGDIISVEETPVTFTISTMRNFLRFGFSSAIPGF